MDASLKVPFLKKISFVKLNETCQKQLPIVGIQPPSVILDCPSALLSSKAAPSLKRIASFR